MCALNLRSPLLHLQLQPCLADEVWSTLAELKALWSESRPWSDYETPPSSSYFYFESAFIKAGESEQGKA